MNLQMRLIVRLSVLVGFMLAVCSADAQHFTNDWVNLAQDYYRLPIPHNGVYRIYRNQLETAGVPIGSFNPQNIQLYQNGKPLACYIEGESTGLLQYIEFYAEGNTGWFDLEMFDKPENQVNPHYSMITDTASVFLTWNKSFSNLRFTGCKSTDADKFPVAEYCIVDTVCQFTATYMGGEENCQYTEAEGWFDGSAVSLGGKVAKQVPTPGLFAGDGLKANVSLALATYSSNGHHIAVEGPGFSHDTIFTGLRNLKYSETVDASLLTASNKFTFSSINDLGATTDYSRVAYIEVEYPSTFEFASRHRQEFVLPEASQDECISISGLEISSDMLLYDVTRNLKIELVQNGNVVMALVPSHSQPVHLIVVDKKAVSKVPYISHTPFADHTKGNKQVVIVTHSSLMQEARKYAEYRDAYLVDVDELYGQFGYGLVKHPLAIRHFVEYITEKWTVKPEYLFIIGKGVNAYESRKNAQGYANNLVPTLGYPASDALLSAFVDGSGLAPSLATGRLSALSGTDVELYFDKVKAYESNEQSEWMKRVLHFVGGKTTVEQTIMRSYMSNYKTVIEDTLFGGKVTSFYKSTSDPISTSRNDSVRILINGGVSLMTFFGHGSSGGGFDQDIDAPSYYNNKGKYPLIFSNSCYAGNIFTVWQNTVSEEWVLAPQKGAIGLIAMVNEGIPNYLNIFASSFYQNIANYHYGESIGKSMREAQAQMSSSFSRLTIGTMQQMTLHGDPCLVLNSSPLPDLQIVPEDVWFSPSLLTTAVDSFTVSVAVRNVGRSITSGFDIVLQHTLPDGTVSVDSQCLDGLKYRDTVRFRLPVDRLNGAGLNKFDITLDGNYDISEMNEENNSVSVSSYVLSASLTALWPYRYSLNPQVPQTLKASTYNPLPESQTGIFQIDTVESFSSPFLATATVSHVGGIVEWEPTATLTEGQTYFWRVRSESDDEYLNVNSFVARKGQTGWEQSCYDQIDDDAFDHINADWQTHSFSFSSGARTIRCHNIGSPNSSNFLKVGYVMDGYSGFSSCGAANALLMVVIDSFDLVPWQSDRGSYGQANYPHCSSNPFEQYFIFYMNNVDAGLDSLVSMVENHIPQGDYFMIYSFMSGMFQQWPERAYEAFEGWGASQVRYLNNSVPYIFFAHKGHPDETEEVSGLSTTDQIDFYRTLFNNFNYGTITSPEIGPASTWTGLEWKSVSVDADSADYACVKVFGVDESGNSILVKDSISEEFADLSNIDAGKYSHLKLQFYTRDDEFRTPSQLKYWRVLYSPYTDLAINLKHSWLFKSDTLQEGQQGMAVVAFENVGQQGADSVLAHYWIQTETNRIVEIGYKRLKPLAPGEFVVDTAYFGTLELDPNCVFFAELNPMPLGASTYDQMEQTHFNNFLQKPFCVVTDKRNPLMDVTFDGRHIRDGELISSKPVIEISLADDNEYLHLSDTNLISIYLKSMSTGVEQKVELSGNPIEAIPSVDDNGSRLRLVWTPMLIDDTYQLRVRAHDASGNESGTDDYLISFSVISENSISEVYAYPNPFSSSTRFAFELTGSAFPDELQIDIYNAQGTVVKTITMADLADVHIGWNPSAYVWNGTNSNGALLPSGLYFYKVTVKLNGKTHPTHNFGTASYLTNGVGRILIVR